MIASAEEVDAPARIDRNVGDVRVRVAGGELFPAGEDFVRRHSRDRHGAKAKT
jgi:hypothetical protein